MHKIHLYKNKISAFLLIALALFPIYRPALQSITLIAFSLFTIIFYFSNIKERIKVKTNSISFFCLTGYLLWAILSVLWTTNKSNLIKEIQPSLILLLLPFVIIYFHPIITKKLKTTIFATFILSNIILSLYLYNFIEVGTARWMSFYKSDVFLYENHSFLDKLKYLKDLTYKWSFAYGNFMEVSKRDFHKGYISSSFLISIALSLFLVFKTKSKLIVKLILIVTVVYLTLWLLYLKSVVNIIAYSGFVFFIILELKQKKHKLIIASSLVIIIFSLGFLLKDNLKSKIDQTQFFQEEPNPMHDEGYIIDYQRTKIYRTTYSLLSKPKTFVFGVGYADSEILLNNRLASYPEFPKDRLWNTHSELLHFWLSGGIINFLLLIMAFTFLIYKSLKNNNALSLCIILIVFLNIVFENYLSRVMGAYLSAFFICILSFNHIEFKKETKC